MIEAVFAAAVKHIVGLALNEGIKKGLIPLVEQEINTIDINRIISQPLRTGYAHLRNAELEEEAARQVEHLEHARLEFVKAADLDAPLAAARAACYAGFCHYFMNEQKHALDWFERSLSMFRKMRNDIQERLISLMKAQCGFRFLWTAHIPFVDDLSVIASLYIDKVQSNLLSQESIVIEHESPVIDLINILRARLSAEEHSKVSLT